MNKKIGINKFCSILKENIKNICIVNNKSFKDLTTFKIGGKICALIEVKEVGTLLKVLEFAKKYNQKYFVLGFGSNTLASDKKCKMLVIKICINDFKVRGNQIVCGAGLGLFRLNQVAIKSGLCGLEWSYGIPGSVGGAIKMNAGSFGGQMKDVVKCVYYTDGEKIYKKEGPALNFGYRSSFFSNNNFVILKVVFELKPSNSEQVEKSCFDFYSKRRRLQPYEYPSAGSVFKRPDENMFAPVLIESCGLKGFKVGGAEISKKHCGFIVNKNLNAKFVQVDKIINKIKKTVEKKFGIILKEEIIIIR